MKLQRRTFFRLAGTTALATLFPGGLVLRRAKADPMPEQRFLFVITASGGASIIDSFWPVVDVEVSSRGLARRRVCYPERSVFQPPGSAIRCVRNLRLPGPFQNAYDPSQFLSRYYEDMLVMAVENTSVNHTVAQKRAITGAGINQGRTIMEAMAIAHGESLVLPSCNSSSGGYLEPGDDASVPDWARAEVITEPNFFAASTHGYRGIRGAPESNLIASARTVRDQLEERSEFGGRFTTSRLRSEFLRTRREVQARMEGENLIDYLLMSQSSQAVPLEEYGLHTTPEWERLIAAFPRLSSDSLHAQAALAFLLARYGYSSALTLGPGFRPNTDGTRLSDTPIAFDFSHGNHTVAQNVMWSRIMEVVDGLIQLLKSTPLGDSTMWQRSLVYVATDFGRSKDRPDESESCGTGHDLNNGNLFISPLLQGNRYFGRMINDECRTIGFDPLTGDANEEITIREGHLYSLVAQAMGIDFPGRYSMDALLRSAG